MVSVDRLENSFLRLYDWEHNEQGVAVLQSKLTLIFAMHKTMFLCDTCPQTHRPGNEQHHENYNINTYALITN